MGPKRAENAGKGNKLSQSIAGLSSSIVGGTIAEQESQYCVGKFAADFELCCREATPPYPVTIAVQIRGHPPLSAPYASSLQLSQVVPNAQQSQQQQQQPHQSQQQAPHSGTYPATPATPSLAGGNPPDDQLSSVGKKTSRARIPSVAGQSATALGMNVNDYDGRSFILPTHESTKTASSYRTFHLVRDSEFFRAKLLVESATNDPDSIDQITVLFMRAWQLDQRLIDIFKRVLPLQEQLHTLNFTYVGLNEHTIHGIIELCQITKNVKNVILDGNPLAAPYFHLLIDKEDSKIVYLSLRFCEINNSGAETLALGLGSMHKQNWKLLNLVLTGNQIGDQGAKALATALRYNRTLISLNLSSNLISDEGATHLALVLRRIVLTPEEIVYRRYLIGKRYAETHPDDPRNHISSPTPSNFSTKSKSGRDSRLDARKATDLKKTKGNSKGSSQQTMDKRNRTESDENRPPSGNKAEQRRGKNDPAGTRGTNLNTSGAGASSRRTPTNPPATTMGKDTETTRGAGPARVKKVAAAVNATSKKNISSVKEENEQHHNEDPPADTASPEKALASQITKNERDNPLLETNEVESHDAEVWLKGNYVLLNLNLSRNHLTMKSVKEFLLTIQQQTALTQLTDALASTGPSANASLIDFSGLCRLELKGMSEISVKSSEYQSLETLLIQKNPTIRCQQYREREAREATEAQTSTAPPPTASAAPEKATIMPERGRIGSSIKASNARPSSRLKE